MALVVLGGGPAGLAVAHFAHRGGMPVLLLEKEGEVGGNCRTLRCGAHGYDTGAHRFHDRDPEVTSELRALLGDELMPVRAPSRIWDRGRFVPFPPTPVGMLRSLSLSELLRAGLDLWRGRRRPGPVVSFEDYALKTFGELLARRYLLGYTEKVWGLPAARLAPAVGTRRLSGMSLGTLALEILMPWRGSAHIDGAFLYPACGYGRIPGALVAALPESSVRLGCAVSGLEVAQGRIRRVLVEGADPVEVLGDVVSTLPLSLLARWLSPHLAPEALEAACGLRFRSVRLLFLRLGQSEVSPNASIYLPDPGLCVTRLYEPKNRSRLLSPSEETSLVAEIPCSEGEPVAELDDDELAARVMGELAGVGLIDPERVVEWRHHWLPNAYPIYELGFEERVATVLRALEGFENLHTVGRNGLFFYSHLHDQVRFAIDLVADLETSFPRAAAAEDEP